MERKPLAPPGYSRTFYKRQLPSPPAIEFASDRGSWVLPQRPGRRLGQGPAEHSGRAGAVNNRCSALLSQLLLARQLHEST